MRTFLTVLAGGVGGALAIFLTRIGGFGETMDELIWQGLGRSNLSTLVSSDGSLFLGVLLSFCMAWVAVDVPRGSQRWLLGLLLIFLLGTGSLVLAMYEILFSPVSPIVGAFFGLAVTSVLTRIGPGAFRRRVDEVFGASLSRRSLRSLYDGPAASLRGAHAVKVTVVSLHAVHHQSLLDGMSPEDFAVMNRAYFTLASDYLCEAGGFLESSSGQHLRVVFGVPTVDETSAQTAARAVLELSNRWVRLNLEADSKWHHLLDCRIGVATGTVVCGVFGCPRSLSYAVAGPCVELADRLASACGVYGTKILLCMETQREAAEAIEVRPIDLMRDSTGQDSEIYELLCAKGSLSPERKRSRDHFWTGVNLTRSRKWEEAVEEFAKSRIKGIPDAALDFYLQKIERERVVPGKSPDAPLISRPLETV